MFKSQKYSAQTEEGVSCMEKLKAVINKYWKVYVAALIIAAVCDLIGTLKFNIGIGTLTLFPIGICHDLWRTFRTGCL